MKQLNGPIRFAHNVFLTLQRPQITEVVTSWPRRVILSNSMVDGSYQRASIPGTCHTSIITGVKSTACLRLATTYLPIRTNLKCKGKISQLSVPEVGVLFDQCIARWLTTALQSSSDLMRLWKLSNCPPLTTNYLEYRLTQMLSTVWHKCLYQSAKQWVINFISYEIMKRV